VGGGGARSPFWNQLKADLTGRTVRATEQSETSALGAAMLAGVAGGAFPTIEAAAGMVRLGALHRPRPDASYEAAHRAYRELYPRLRDLFG
jgi:xylulokinase